MTAAIWITLAAAARQVLAARCEQPRDADPRLRDPLVLLAADDRTAPQVAPVVRRSPATVARVLQRYLADGPDGVPHRPRPGRATLAPPTWEPELRRVIALEPDVVGVASATW